MRDGSNASSSSQVERSSCQSRKKAKWESQNGKNRQRQDGEEELIRLPALENPSGGQPGKLNALSLATRSRRHAGEAKVSARSLQTLARSASRSKSCNAV